MHDPRHRPGEHSATDGPPGQPPLVESEDHIAERVLIGHHDERLLKMIAARRIPIPKFAAANTPT
jgi:hypothetical protein